MIDDDYDDDNNGMLDDKRRLQKEAEGWHFRLMNDPQQFEKEAFIDRIKEINFAIKEFRKLYEKVPVTNHLFRAKVLREIERSERTSKIQTEYEMFKRYKMRAAISK